MSELNCHQVHQIIQSFLDGELPAEHAARVGQHLDRCRECGIEAATIERVRAALAALRPPTHTAALDRLRRGLDEVVG